ncbi:MAG: prefoldin subunit alpha [Candidatus Aenigmatarchaeota archaeon]
MSERELQEKVYQFQVLEEKFKELNQRRELFAVKLMEVEQTKQAIEDILNSNEEEIMIPLGSGVFAHGKVDKKQKMLVSFGSDIVIEKDVDEVKSILDKRKKILEEGIESVKDTMLKVAKDMQNIQYEAEELISKQEKAG